MKLVGFLRKKYKINQLVDKTISTVEEEDIEKAKEHFLEMMENNPRLREELLTKLGVRVNEDEQTPNELLDGIALGITKNKEIPDSVLDETVSDKLTDDGIKDLILNGNMTFFRQNLLVNKIQDNELKEKMKELIEERRIKSQTIEERKKEQGDCEKLVEIYKNCSDLTDWDIVNNIKDINVNEQDKKSQQLLRKIIAKKIADNYSKFGTSTISTFSYLIPVEDMFAENIPELVENEWNMQKRQGNYAESNYNYTQRSLRGTLLEHIAKKSINSYLETGRFSVPQSEMMHKITSQEENNFIKTLEKELNDNLSRVQLKDVHAQIRGIIGVNDKIEKFEENLLDMSSGQLDRYLKICTEILNNDSFRSTVQMLQKSGVMNQLEKMSTEDRKKAVQGFANVLEHRNQVKSTYKVAPTSPKIKGNSDITNGEGR